MALKTCEKCQNDNVEIAKYCNHCGFALPKSEPVIENKIETKQKKTTRISKKVFVLIVSLIVFGVSYFVAREVVGGFVIDKALMAAASELNESCPIVVDQDTRLDNAIGLPDNVFQYNYTLVNFVKEEVNSQELKDFIEPTMVNNVKTNPDMRFFRDKKTTIVYYYKDKYGEFILKISITPDMYQ